MYRWVSQMFTIGLNTFFWLYGLSKCKLMKTFQIDQSNSSIYLYANHIRIISLKHHSGNYIKWKATHPPNKYNSKKIVRTKLFYLYINQCLKLKKKCFDIFLACSQFHVFIEFHFFNTNWYLFDRFIGYALLYLVGS